MVKCLRQSIQEFLKTRLDLSMRSKSNRSLSLLVFDKRRKPKYPEKKPLGASERTNNKLKTNIWRRRWDLNPGHIDGSECLHHCATCVTPDRTPSFPTALPSGMASLMGVNRFTTASLFLPLIWLCTYCSSVGGECSHSCATLATPDQIMQITHHAIPHCSFQ